MNSLSVRSYNERLVLSLLLQNEGISRMDIGQKTGLSAQTVSVIVRSLEQEGLVAMGEALRGRVGPPTIRLSLNPEGAFAVGIGFGYRLIEVVLIDFIGTVRFHRKLPSEAAHHPATGALVEAVKAAVASLPPGNRGRIAGVGLAIPDDIEAWTGDHSAKFDLDALQKDLEEQVGLPVFVQNDITAAAGGESLFGTAKSLNDYLFFYLGARLHTRLILNHQIYRGYASISSDVGMLRLEKMLAKKALPTDVIWDQSGEWPDFGGVFDAWRQECLASLQRSIEALGQFVHVGTVVLSSYAPGSVCRGICDDLNSSVQPTKFMQSGIAISPKAVGAAGLPFSSRLMVQ